MNSTDFRKVMGEYQAEIIANKSMLLGHKRMPNVGECSGYFFLLTEIYRFDPSDLLQNALRSIFYEWHESERDNSNVRWNITDGKLTLLNFYCRIKSQGILSNIEYVSKVIDDLEQDLISGRIRKTGLMDGIAGIVSVLLCLYQLHPSDQIKNIISNSLIRIIEASEWDSFGLSLCRKYDHFYGDGPQPTYNSINLHNGSAGVRYMLSHLQQFISKDSVDLKLFSDLLFSREEKLFFEFGYRYPDLEFPFLQADSTEYHKAEPNYYRSGLGILSVNALTRTFSRGKIGQRIKDMKLSSLSLKTGWAGTFFNSKDLKRGELFSETTLEKTLAAIDISHPYDENEGLGAFILEMKSHGYLIPYMMPFVYSPPCNIKLDITNRDIYDFIVAGISPNVCASLKNRSFDSYQFLSKFRGLDAKKIMHQAFLEYNDGGEVLEEKFKVDRLILDLRYKCTNKADIYSKTTKDFLGQLKLINLDDDSFLDLELGLPSTTILIDLINSWKCVVNRADDRVKDALNYSASVSDPEEVILINLTKPGYPTIVSLSDFYLILGCLKRDHFSTVRHAIEEFKTFVEIEEDVDVQKFFFRNCRRVLEEAIIEGWIDINSVTFTDILIK